MNRKITIWGASHVVAAVVLTSSCDPRYGNPDDSFVDLRLECAGMTKVPEAEKDDEDRINSITYYIFDEDGDLEASVNSISSGSKTEVKVRNGKKTIYALVNSPGHNDPEDETELLETVSFLKDNKPDNLVMAGSVHADVEQDMEVSITVSRLTGKIVVKEVAFESGAVDKDRIKLNDMYLINVSPSLTYGGDESSRPEDWLNKMGFSSSDADILLSDRVDSTIMDGCSYDLEHTFYAYPNTTEEDIHGGSTFTPRFTRLVISTDMGFYSIDLPGIRSNTAFIINKVTISKTGSDNPDDTPDEISFTVDLVVKDWSAGEGYIESI